MAKDDEIFKDNLLSKDEIKEVWRLIDRKLKRAVPEDDEISGKPNYLMGDPELIPLSLRDGVLNALGGLTASSMYDTMEKVEKSKYIRNMRYKKCTAAQEKPEIEGILNIYADEATTEDENGEIIHIQHPNKKVVDIVEELFTRVGIYDGSWERIWNMCGYGDEFMEVIPNQKATRVHQLNWIPRECIERIEKNGVLVGFKDSPVDEYTSGNTFTFKMQLDALEKNKSEEGLIFPFRILHWRIPSSKYTPYGKAVIDSVLAAMEQLDLMIKSLLIARATRSPERRIYNVDVGNLQGEKAIKYANEAVSYLRKKKTMQLYAGDAKRMDAIRDVFGSTEDIVLPKRTGSEGNSITTLEQLGTINIDDVNFIRDRIFAPVGIPRQYLFDDTFQYSNTNLSSKSIPFSKKIRRIQRYHLQPLYKLATIELKLRKFSDEEISQLVLLMNNPSNLDQQEKVNNETSVWNLVGTIKALNAEKVFYPDYLLYREYLNLNDDEIVELMKISQLQQAGENIFNFLPVEERPVGAEDLTSAPPPAPEGEVGAPGGGALPPAPIPGEVEGALGPTETAGATPPAGGEGGAAAPAAPTTPEVADIQQPTEGKQEFFETIEELKKPIISQNEEKIKEALTKKRGILEKLKSESLEKLKAIQEEKENLKQKEKEKVQEKTRMGYKYLESSGDFKGFNDWITVNQKEDQEEYFEDED